MLKVIAIAAALTATAYVPSPPLFSQFGEIAAYKSGKITQSGKRHCIWRRVNGRAVRICQRRAR